eukprot:sb/3477149/
MPTSISRRSGPGVKNKEEPKAGMKTQEPKAAEKKDNLEEKEVEKNETQEFEKPMETSDDTPVTPKEPADKPKEETAVLNYKPPKWSGAPAFPYTLEVLKNGKILDEVDID